MADIAVQCTAADAGWRCAVTVTAGGGSSHHQVTVGAAVALDLAAATTLPAIERLVDETFAFLLEREPKESILSVFDITVVGRYFPDFEHEMRRRLAP